MSKGTLNEKKIFGGLTPSIEDKRDIKFGAIYKLPPIKDVPANFLVAEPLIIKDQKDTDFCTGYGSTYASEVQEGVILSPEYQYAMACKIRNNFNEWGMDLRTILKSLQNGSLPIDKVPAGFVYDGTNRDFLANWENWEKANPEFDNIDNAYRKETYFIITPESGYDLFDAIRATLWFNRIEKRYAISGALWKHAWTQAPEGVIESETPNGQGFGHCFDFIGSKEINGEIYLIALLSNGIEIGNQGYFYFPRAVVNKEFVYGTYTLKDIAPEVAKQLSKMKLGIRFRWLANLIVAIKKLFT